MSSNKKPLAVALGTALAGGLVLGGSAFAMTPLAQGYMLAAAAGDAEAQEGDATDKAKEASCGADKAKEGKCGEGKCGEGKCGGDKASAEGKCGEGKCGMDKMDTDKDGRLSRAEFDASHKWTEGNTTAMDDWEEQNAKKFADHDSDGDGFITQAEMDKHHADMKAGGEGKCGEGKCGEGKCGSN